MANPANAVCTRSSVRAYLLAAFDIEDGRYMDEIMRDPKTVAAIESGNNFRSHAYYVGNEIATRYGLTDSEGYDPDAGGDED